MARRFTPAGFSLLIIFLPTLGMFGDPLGDSLFGSEALDYFRLTIRPKNVYHPAESGVFPRHESGPMLGHLPKYALAAGGVQAAPHFQRLAEARNWTPPPAELHRLPLFPNLSNIDHLRRGFRFHAGFITAPPSASIGD
jgi:hypothetical protein